MIYPPGNRYCRFGLREEEWIKHVLITGMTGTGKTNLMFQTLRELRRHNKPFVVFDWKRNYRDLRQLPEFKTMAVFTVGTDVVPMRFNPLIPPPGTAPGQWLMKLVDVLKHAYFVGEGVEYLLREAIDQVYEHCGFFDGSFRDTPTFFAVRDYITKKHLVGRMMLWKASAVRVLESLCFRHGLGPVVNADTGLDTGLLDKFVVMELDTLSDSDKVFFTEAVILWLYEYCKNEGKRETFKHALVIEEGHHILSHKKEHAEGVETIMETCLRQPRRLKWFLLKAHERGSPMGYVLHRDGQRVGDIKRSFVTARRRAGLKDVTPHTLRHTAGTWMAQRGVPLWEIGGFLGHNHERTTELYGHHHPDYLRKAREALD